MKILATLLLCMLFGCAPLIQSPSDMDKDLGLLIAVEDDFDKLKQIYLYAAKHDVEMDASLVKSHTDRYWTYRLSMNYFIVVGDLESYDEAGRRARDELEWMTEYLEDLDIPPSHGHDFMMNHEQGV